VLGESWIDSVANRTENMQECILMSAMTANSMEEFNVMMIGWECGVVVRAGVVQAVRTGLEDFTPV
jgi:hypothetical protein